MAETSLDVGRLLETLHPMREPPPPESIVPYLALLAFGCLCGVVVLILAARLRHRSRAMRAAAEDALRAARGLGDSERLAAQAQLLRRLVRGLAGDEAARAQGEAWLRRLDQVFATHFFTTGAGTAFGDALYRPARGLDLDAMDKSLGGLIAKVRTP